MTTRTVRRPRALLLLLALAAVLLTGCATVPTSTPALAVDGGQDTGGTTRVADPKDTTDPYAVPGQFARASADPTDDHAAARAYLTPAARKSWNTRPPIRIIDEGYDSGDVNVNNDRGIGTLTLRARQLGLLQEDGSFVAKPAALRIPLTLRRRADGQWRISRLPAGVLVPKTQFTTVYGQRQIYFYDPTMQVLVPDLRWVRNERRPLGLANQLIDLLLSGPPKSMDGAVRSAIPGSAAGASTVSRMDGKLVVGLNQLGEQSPNQLQQIYRQVSDSLASVFGQIEIQADGRPLSGPPSVTPGNRHPVPPNSLIVPAAEDGGVVVADGVVRGLENGLKIPGPAGNGGYQVSTAGLSTDGEQLAVVSDAGKGAVLRVGGYGAARLQKVDIRARNFTQPSWGLRNPKRSNDGGEVWTVADGKRVTRVTSDQAGEWSAQPVDAGALRRMGRITQLRLSRDGARFAAIADGKLVLGFVRREPDSVALDGLSVLGDGASQQYVDVAWRDQDSFVVIRNDNGVSWVIEYSADGLLDDRYSNSNLTPPLSAITAAPGRPVITMDTYGMWSYNADGNGWRRRPSFGPNMVPLYPG